MAFCIPAPRPKSTKFGTITMLKSVTQNPYASVPRSWSARGTCRRVHTADTPFAPADAATVSRIARSRRRTLDGVVTGTPDHGDADAGGRPVAPVPNTR